MINRLKQNKGLTGVDLTIAVIIIIMFISLITTIFYNLYISSNGTKRNTQATAYITQLFEEISLMDYDNVTEDNLLTKISNLDLNSSGVKQNIISGKKVSDANTLITPYKMEIQVQNYNEIPGNESKQDVIKIIQATVKYNIGSKEETITIKRLKTKEVAAIDSLGISPKISDGMVPVKYIITNETTQEGYWQVTTTSDSEWFDYSKSKWANVMLKDGLDYDQKTGKVNTVGSMFVYIPRYAYKISYNDASNISEGGRIDIVFLKGTTDKYEEDQTEKTAKRVTETNIQSSDYIVHPCFTKTEDNSGNKTYDNGEWDVEVEGIWVAKFEASSQEGNINTVDGDNLTTKILQIKPGVQSWRHMTIGNAYTVAKDAEYGLTDATQINKLNSHMIKNSEWGAVAYLTYSKYGRNTIEISINNSNNYITGSSAGKPGDSTTNGSTVYEYNTIEGVKASTTGNIYGIYDMNGGSTEFVASYYNVGESSKLDNGNSFASSNGSSTQYATAYTGTDLATSYKKGDATYETKGWFSDLSEFVQNMSPFFGRGGSYENAEKAGMYYFSCFDGDAYEWNSFRTCLIIEL